MSDTIEKLIREKVDLIDVIDYAIRDWDDYLEECHETETPPIDSFEDFIADGIISAGYRKQEWIPAKDPPKESGEYIVMIHKAANPTTLMYHAGEKAWFEVTMEDGEELYTYYSVDYWMPLPEPPKGD